MGYEEFAEKIRTMRKLAGLTPGQVAGVMAEQAAMAGQDCREEFWERRGCEPDRFKSSHRRYAARKFASAWDWLIDFGATDDMRDACRSAWYEAFYSEALRPYETRDRR